MEGMCNDRNIRLQLICDESLDDVKLDASLFEQVLVNIIKNAAESIGQDGQIIIRTSLPTAIEVVDNGPGISKETEAKLFSPFFSTKPNGQGDVYKRQSVHMEKLRGWPSLPVIYRMKRCRSVFSEWR